MSLRVDMRACVYVFVFAFVHVHSVSGRIIYYTRLIAVRGMR